MKKGQSSSWLNRSLTVSMLRTREAIMARFRPLLAAYGVTEQQWRVLRALAFSREMRAGELAQASVLSVPSLSRILRAMDDQGLIVRRVEKTDLRASLISLTPQGRALFEEIAPQSELRYRALVDCIGRERVVALLDLLDEATALMSADAPPGGDLEEEADPDEPPARKPGRKVRRAAASRRGVTPETGR